jgi:integrase
VLLLFLLDTGIRSPSELVNVRVNDLSEECTKLRIRDESSKTFGRTINLLLSSALLREYLREQRRDGMDQLFPINPGVTNRYLRRLAIRILGKKQSPGGAPYSAVNPDFRTTILSGISTPEMVRQGDADGTKT